MVNNKVITIPEREYQSITQHQIFLEKELAFLRKIVLGTEEDFIRPAILRRWERISHALDQGKGYSFASVKEMKNWLKKI